MKQTIILDPAFRKLDEIFEPTDLERLYSLADVIWGRDDPMPPADFEQVKREAFAIITGRWRHGEVAELPKLRGILEVGGRHPSPQALDYKTCFARRDSGVELRASLWADGSRDGTGYGACRGPPDRHQSCSVYPG